GEGQRRREQMHTDSLVITPDQPQVAQRARRAQNTAPDGEESYRDETPKYSLPAPSDRTAERGWRMNETEVQMPVVRKAVVELRPHDAEQRRQQAESRENGGGAYRR